MVTEFVLEADIMDAFDRTFSLVASFCLVAWLIAIVPAMVGYAGAFGTLSVDDVKHTAMTIAAIVAFAIFWGLAAILAKLSFSDWLAARRRRQQPGH